MQRADADGEDPASTHYRRMLWLLVVGLIHFYLIWFGDILIGYALMGMIAYFFRNLPVRKLILWGIAFVTVQLLSSGGLSAATTALEASATAPGADPSLVREWETLQRDFGILTGQYLSDTMRLFRGGYLDIVRDRVFEHGTEPFTYLFIFGWETLGYMLFGMAALKSGYLKGEWSDAAYRKAALIGFGIGIPAYALLAWILARDGFSVPMVFAVAMTATVPFRPLMVVATAALIILLTRRGGALVERIAAAGRAAFTNYLGTSILMTTFFYGYGGGLFGTVGRAELWLVVVAMWGVMLLWSKPWLDRYRYGPLEWLWRTLARGEVQPMRRKAPSPT
jgi:uncharacterized protein